MNKGLLFLAHRMPYPPNKGDKIRSFHLMRHLAKDYSVIWGAWSTIPPTGSTRASSTHCVQASRRSR